MRRRGGAPTPPSSVEMGDSADSPLASSVSTEGVVESSEAAQSSDSADVGSGSSSDAAPSSAAVETDEEEGVEWVDAREEEDAHANLFDPGMDGELDTDHYWVQVGLTSHAQVLWEVLAQCQAAGQLMMAEAARYKMKFDRSWTPEQQALEAAVLSDLAAAGDLVEVAQLVRDALR